MVLKRSRSRSKSPLNKRKKIKDEKIKDNNKKKDDNKKEDNNKNIKSTIIKFNINTKDKIPNNDNNLDGIFDNYDKNISINRNNNRFNNINNRNNRNYRTNRSNNRNYRNNNNINFEINKRIDLSEINKKIKKEYKYISEPINTIDDLIHIGEICEKKYNIEKYEYNINLQAIVKLVAPLKK